MRDHEQRARALLPAGLQMLRQPGDGAHVQVVRRLVEREHVPVADEQAHEVDAAALPARKRAHHRIPGDVAGQPGDDVADARVARPHVLGQIAHHGLLHGCRGIERVGLPQHAHAHGTVAQHAPLVGLKRARQQIQQRRLAVAVAADDAHAVALVHAERHIREHLFRGELDPHLLAPEHKRHRAILFHVVQKADYSACRQPARPLHEKAAQQRITERAAPAAPPTPLP